MRFNKFVLSSIAILAWIGNNGITYAEESSLSKTADDVQADIVNSENYQFQAEVSKVLDIVVHSLYTNKEVFLRELISNASDALDKIRFLSITDPAMLGDKKELEIRISFDDEKNTLTIVDSGIGMTKDELIKNLGTVARSGTSNFMAALKEGAADVSQIGMFGVGFYSAFLVADKVTVASKHPHEDTQHLWTSDGGLSSFNIGEDPRGNTLGRGTEITIHLKEDAEEYAQFDRISQLVEHYSEFITHPIYVRKKDVVQVPEDDDESGAESEEGDMEVSEEDPEKTKKMKDLITYSWEKSNADAAIWNRPKEEISDEEYQEFYKVINKDGYQDAQSWTHFDAEGNINFKSLIYMPKDIPSAFTSGDFSDYKSSVRLYVRKVLISDNFELLPRYLSFVRGVVDSDDLPLNVNRETLQESKIISIIRKKVTRKVLDMMAKFAEDSDAAAVKKDSEEEVEIDEEGNIIEKEKDESEPKEVENEYLKWYEDFHVVIKMGIMEDEPNKKRLSKLIRFKSSKSDGKFISFQDYIDRMKEGQKELYYIAGNNMKELERSPFLEKFNKKGVEVMYFTAPVDEYFLGHLRDIEGKKISSVTKENTDFGEDEDKDMVTRRSKAYDAKYSPLVKFLKKFYGTNISRVVISKRLESAPAIVSASTYGMSANQQKIMKAQVFAMGEKDPFFGGSDRILEINPRHPFIDSLLSKVPEDPEFDAKALPIDMKDTLWNLLDTALINGDYPITELRAFRNRMMRSIKSNLGLETVELLPEIEPLVEEDVPPEMDVEGDGINLDDFDIDAMDI